MSAEVKSMKEWALYYAELGLAVFPLAYRNKVPAIEGGCKAATTEKSKIERWWNQNPRYNIGIATGNKSNGLVVIDLDVDKNKGIDGYEVLRDWQNKHGELPETWQSITGRGGYHYFYKDTITHSNKVGLYEGVDIRGEGGYIVAPPSVHPNGNNRVKVVPFERHFTEKEQNKHLKEQLQQEIDGILNWCIQGLSLYRKEGLEPPTAVQIATHEYSEDSDKIGKFISECLEKSDENLAAKDVYEKYSQWCNDCGLGVDGRTSFYEELKTKNLLSKTGTVTGKTVKNVIKGYSFAEETFHSVDRGLDAPFS